ncbi:MAG: preprotein translocase subunit SecE [Thiothrix sp.]
MSTHTEEQGTLLDTIKLTVAIALLLAGIVGFYYFESWQGQSVSVLLRVLGLLLVVGIASATALSSLSGKRFLGFMRDSRLEVRKMVWPTRAETTQTTLMVIVIVLILSIFLWGIDSLLGWGVKTVLGGSA